MQHLKLRTISKASVLLVLSTAFAVGGLLSQANAGGPLASKPAKGQTTKSKIKPASLKGKIVFGRGKDVYAINPDGSDETCLINNIHNYGQFNDISPDGRKVLYANWGNVFLFGLNGHKWEQFPVGGQIQARFSPDGNKAICSSGKANKYGDILGDLYELNLKTGKFRLSFGSNDITLFDQPSWSPDGKRLVFVGSEDTINVTTAGMTITEIYTVNADESGRVRLTDNDEQEESPAFSPDGAKIVYVRHNRIKYQGDFINISNIYIMNADGSGQTALTSFEADSEKSPVLGNGRGIDSASPTFSPDGKKITFSSNRGSRIGSDEIYIMNVDGSQRRRLTPNSGGKNPHWR